MQNDPQLLNQFQAATEKDGRGLFRFDQAEAGTVIRGSIGGHTRADSIDATRYTSEAMVSTNDLDRYDSIIEPGGWQTDNFRKSPTVFWGHEDWKLPIGKSLEQRILPYGMWAKTQFAVNESPQRVGEIFALHANGYIGAWSVGWIPLEWEEFQIEKDGATLRGVRFTKNELLEYSLVGVPGNAKALTLARMALASARRHGTKLPESELTGDLGILSRACQLAVISDDIPNEILQRAKLNARMIAAFESCGQEIPPAPGSGSLRAIEALESALVSMKETGASIMANG